MRQRAAILSIGNWKGLHGIILNCRKMLFRTDTVALAPYISAIHRQSLLLTPINVQSVELAGDSGQFL